MIKITYLSAVAFISAVWLAVRLIIALKNRRVSLKREAELLLVYVCLVVVARFTFFPFSLVNGKVAPLIFDAARVFPPRVNFIPLKNLFDYPTIKEALVNVLGNTLMFLPLGIVWPKVFLRLDTYKKVT
jgi:glycopeptide antibiotics resistance protein